MYTVPHLGLLWIYIIKQEIFSFQGFGSGVTDMVLSQGVLAVSYSNKSVKLYSFEHIVQRVCMCSAGTISCNIFPF